MKEITCNWCGKKHTQPSQNALQALHGCLGEMKMELKFDEWNLEQVAEVVHHFNPNTNGIDLVAHMMRTAKDLKEPGYICTYGYMLTAYRMPDYLTGGDDILYIKASVDGACFRGVDLGVK